MDKDILKISLMCIPLCVAKCRMPLNIITISFEINIQNIIMTIYI